MIVECEMYTLEHGEIAYLTVMVDEILIVILKKSHYQRWFKNKIPRAKQKIVVINI